MSEPTKKIYLAAKNDGLFIIDKPPRPAPADDPADIPNVTVIARFCDNSRETQTLAEAMVAAYNAARQCHE